VLGEELVLERGEEWVCGIGVEQRVAVYTPHPQMQHRPPYVAFCARPWQLQGVAVRPRATLEDALRLGRHTFLGGQRIDMSAIAHELGVNRVTLYRWIGSRDRLLVEVIWSLADRAITAADQSTTARGAERIVQITTRFIDTVIANPGMQAWLAEEGEHAMRLLTRHQTDFQPRLIHVIERLLAEETDAGRLDVPAAPTRSRLRHRPPHRVIHLPGPDHRRRPPNPQRRTDPPHAPALAADRRFPENAGGEQPPTRDASCSC
jgi:AcrR family transcriptional regulator